MTTSGVSPEHHRGEPGRNWCKPSLIALSHIHVSAAYRSRIYENFDTPRSEPYFVRATYLARTCDVPATFQRRIKQNQTTNILFIESSDNISVTCTYERIWQCRKYIHGGNTE